MTKSKIYACNIGVYMLQSYCEYASGEKNRHELAIKRLLSLKPAKKVLKKLIETSEEGSAISHKAKELLEEF